MKRKIIIEFDNLTQINYLSNLLTKEADRLQDDIHELCEGPDPFMEGGHDSSFYKYFHDIMMSLYSIASVLNDNDILNDSIVFDKTEEED